jgi:putative transposase
MPRKARIDAPGALHHIIIKGIERRAIFKDDQDYSNFLERLGDLLSGTSTPCYAWALMPNHVHLLLQTGLYPLATVMRRLLTGYAQQFNRRHDRHGHLFQNRYKSFLCEEDPYLLELVRYIHLNPLRAGLVKDLRGLASYRNSGHSALMGRVKREWQDTDYALRLFGERLSSARKAYVAFVAKGVKQGRRPELVGGGLLRSVGGWSVLKGARGEELRLMGDERILGSSEFVENALKQAEEDYERKSVAVVKGPGLNTLVDRVSRYFGIAPEKLEGSSKQRDISRARSLLCYLAVNRLMISCTDVARKLNISPSAVSKSAIRGRSDDVSAKVEKVVLGTETE